MHLAWLENAHTFTVTGFLIQYTVALQAYTVLTLTLALTSLQHE